MVVSNSYNCIILSDWPRVIIFTRTVQSHTGLISYQSHIISLLVLAHCEITLHVNNLLVNKAELKNTRSLISIKNGSFHFVSMCLVLLNVLKCLTICTEMSSCYFIGALFLISSLT